jgi:O-antigen/teichoic acid export membrane protein
MESVRNNTLFYLIASIIISLIPFLILPFLMNYVEPEKLGRFAMYQVFLTFITPLVALESYKSFEVLFFKEDKTIHINDVVNHILHLALIGFFLILIIIYIFNLFIDSNFNYYLLTCLPFIAVTQQIYNLLLAHYQNTKQIKIYTSLEFFKTFLQYDEVYDYYKKVIYVKEIL